ncbi:MAG: SH3 domain-containing protein [Ruminococcus sp.]|nr:SH3 domain-containing protein [Ruminococcus sp.]
MKIKKILSVFSAVAISAVIAVPAYTYAESTGMVYSDFNVNDVNGNINVNIPENTTAEIMITFTSPEVTDTPYYIINADGKKSVSMDIEGRDTTENDYRNYTLRVALTSTEYDDIVVYTDTFNVPDVNDNPDSFLKCDYNFSVDNDYSGSEWTVSSENETEKNIVIHYGNSEMGDVNGDGFINAVDASIVSIEYSLLSTEGTGTFNEHQKRSANVNKDGFIDAVDASMISIYYAELSTNGNPTWEIPPENQNTTISTSTQTTTTTTTSAITTTTTTTAVTAPETPEYSSYVEAVQLMARKITDSMLHHEYYVHDINNDGTYELIMEMGETEEDNKYSVYSMKGGVMIFAGDIDAEYSYLASDGETLYKVAGQNQIEYVEKISFNGEKVSSENISTDTERRIAIPAYNWTNMSGINRIMNYEPYTYFDITDSDDDFIFNKNYSAEKGKVITVSTNLNLRAKPTTNSGIITTIPNSTIVNIYGHNDGWAYISYENNGKTYYGYASTTYISTEI